MIEKVKSWFLYIATPIAFALGWAWWLLNKNQILKDQLAREKANRELSDSLSTLQHKKETADALEKLFNEDAASLTRALDEYSRNGGNGTGTT